MRTDRLGIRWTIGAVSDRGFEALQLSIWGAWRLFGPGARYTVCVNSLPLKTVRQRVGTVPENVSWLMSDGRLPPFLSAHLDGGLAEGVAWKFAPLRLFPDRYELSLDNDCILWDMPEAIGAWLSGEDGRACILAEDVAPAFGQFAPLCGAAPRNTGIRGLPPFFDLGTALRKTLAACPARLVSELDEQGLQVAALSRARPPLVVTLGEVAICSPFPPHMQGLGSCGAHFVGLNMREPRPWCDRAALDRIGENWERYRVQLYAALGLPGVSRFSSTHWSSGISTTRPSGSV